MHSIEGKVVVITGASSGIGEATALLLAERGAKLVLGSRRLNRLEAIATRIKNAGGDAIYAPTDVKRNADVIGARRAGMQTARPTGCSREQRGHRADLSSGRSAC